MLSDEAVQIIQADNEVGRTLHFPDERGRCVDEDCRSRRYPCDWVTASTTTDLLLADRATLEASLGRATALLRRLLAQHPDVCDEGDVICHTHGFYLPCPVGAARAFLAEKEAT